MEKIDRDTALIIADIIDEKPKEEIIKRFGISEYKFRKVKKLLKDEPDIIKEAIKMLNGGFNVEEVSEEVAKVVEKPKEIVKQGVEGLQALDTEFQQVVSQALSVAKIKLHEDITVKEWALIAKTTAEMYKAIFNKDNQTINVINQNNQNIVATDKLNIFKSKLGV